MGSIELLIDEIDKLGVPYLYPIPEKNRLIRPRVTR
jgi:hypothetical protein